MCNDYSTFSKGTKLSPPEIIEQGDHYSVLAMHYGLVDLIHGYQVEALHAPTF